MNYISEKTQDFINETIVMGCCITRPITFWTVGAKDMGEGFDPWSMLPPLHALQYGVDYEDDPNGPLAKLTFPKNNFKNPMCVHVETEGEMIIADANGEVWYRGLDGNKYWEDTGIPQRGIQGIKNIHGTIYVAGLLRSVYRRDGKDKWTHISEDLSTKTEALKKKTKNHLWTGFDCIDGFEADKDLYAGGGNGDVWHYDGAVWSPIDIPLPKMQIKKICCAEDGYVYITGRFGVLLKGRGDSWETIKHDGSDDELNDVVYYKGKVYVATPYRLYEIDKDKTKLVDFKQKEIPGNQGYLDVNHGLLMTAGRSSAAIFDGENWKILYGASVLDDETERYLAGKVMLKAQDLMDEVEDALNKVPKSK